MIQVILTRKCNFVCRHCMFYCTSRGEHMPVAVFTRAIPYATVSGVNILGGEPYLHPRFEQYFSSLVDSSPIVRLVTNGSWIKDRRDMASFIGTTAAIAARTVFVRISNDSWHRQFIAETDLTAAASLLREYGVECSSDRMDEAALFPLGRASQGDLRDSLKRSGVLASPAECTKGPYDPWDSMSIDVNGNVSPCCHHQAVIGNIMTDNMPTIEQRASDFIAARVSLNPTAGDCSSCATQTQRR